MTRLPLPNCSEIRRAFNEAKVNTIGGYYCKQKAVNNENKEMLTIKSKLKMLTEKSDLCYPQLTPLQSKVKFLVFSWQNETAKAK